MGEKAAPMKIWSAAIAETDDLDVNVANECDRTGVSRATAPQAAQVFKEALRSASAQRVLTDRHHGLDNRDRRRESVQHDR
jgi:hypothetical protein